MPYIKEEDYQNMLSQIKGNAEVLDPYIDLKNDIENDKQVVKSGEIEGILLRDVAKKFGCRERVRNLETGKVVRVKPFRLTDRVYNVVSKRILHRVLKDISAQVEPITASGFDAEDRARRLVNQFANLGINSVGRVISWSGNHAFVVAVVTDDDNLIVEFVETDTKQIVQVGSGKYDLHDSLIIIS